MKYEVDFTGFRTGATSPIDIVYGPVPYTADQYILDCKNNGDPEWIKMLEGGKVSLLIIEEE